jgi:hypothetical protein
VTEPEKRKRAVSRNVNPGEPFPPSAVSCWPITIAGTGLDSRTTNITSQNDDDAWTVFIVKVNIVSSNEQQQYYLSYQQTGSTTQFIRSVATAARLGGFGNSVNRLPYR